jgi:hypothetical protein
LKIEQPCAQALAFLLRDTSAAGAEEIAQERGGLIRQ